MAPPALSTTALGQWCTLTHGGKIFLGCSKHGGVCAGKILLSVAQHQHGQGNTPTCRVCGKVYKVPAVPPVGAPAWPHLPAKPARASRGELPKGKGKGKTAQPLDPLTKQGRLEKENADLKAKLAKQNLQLPTAAEVVPDCTKDLKELQSTLDQLRKLGLTSEAKSVEARLTKAKEANTSPTSLRAVLGQLQAARNHAQQLFDQVALDRERLAGTEKRLAAAAEAVAKLATESEKLAVDEGLAKQVDPTDHLFPELRGKVFPADQQKMLHEATEVFKASILRLVDSFPAADASMGEEGVGNGPPPSPPFRAPGSSAGDDEEAEQ